MLEVHSCCTGADHTGDIRPKKLINASRAVFVHGKMHADTAFGQIIGNRISAQVVLNRDPMTHPALGALNIVGQAVHLTRTPQPPEARLPTPEMGEHNDDILGSLGYDPDAVADLRARGVI